jgi:hypothetical protein
MQFPDDDSFEGATRLASEMMEAAFHRRFPEVKSRVTIGSFAE